MFDKAEINYNYFIRLTEIRHKKYEQNFSTNLEEDEKINKIKLFFIKLAKFSGYYCVTDESFIPEKDLIKQEDGSFRTQLNNPVEFISEENFGLNFKEGNLIDDWLENIQMGKLKYVPENNKKEVQEYINQNLTVNFLLKYRKFVPFYFLLLFAGFSNNVHQYQYS